MSTDTPRMPKSYDEDITEEKVKAIALILNAPDLF